mmetsp:Transcript_11243/g.33717  ORF Transcript_11243/g.33717 Transcript_11243/m.33717 type:complete len:140 (+) Transcript_11243:116-535(+)
MKRGLPELLREARKKKKKKKRTEDGAAPPLVLQLSRAPRSAIVCGVNEVIRALERKRLRVVVLFDHSAAVVECLKTFAGRLNVPVVALPGDAGARVAAAFRFKRLAALGVLLRNEATLGDDEASYDDLCAALFQSLVEP